MDQPHWSSHDVPGEEEANQKYTGDRFNTTWTLPLYTFGGSVVVDDVLNGTVAGPAYTSASASYEAINAVLVDEEGNVTQVVPVSATDGTFDFAGVLGDNYTVMITKDNPTIGNPAPATANLPTEYRTQEEEFNNGGADAMPDSKTNAFHVTAASVGDITDNTLIFGITNIPLPVELINFTAERMGKQAKLQWSTATEINNDHFDIEHSKDAVDFEKIGEVKGAGNTSEIQHYAFVHPAPNTGINYYRLKQVDIDGRFEYTPIRSVVFEEIEDGIFKVSYFPNPTGADLSITTNKNVENYSITVYGVDGRVILQKDFTSGMILDLSDFVSGVYMVQLKDEKGETKSLERIVKSR